MHYEYIIDLAILGGALAVFLVLGGETGPRLPFLLNVNLPRWAYPVKPLAFPQWVEPLIAFLAPTLSFCVYFAMSRRDPSELYRLIVVFTFTVLLTGAIANCMKVALARPCPNFVYSCWPSGKIVLVNTNLYGGYPQCETAPSVWQSHLGSFPAGRTAVTSSGLGFLSFFIMGQAQVYGSPEGHPWRLFAALIPALAAIVIGISNIVTYWRHPTDVIAGWLLGFSLGWLGYRLLYPNLSHPQSNVQSKLLRQGALLAPPVSVHGGPTSIRAPANGPKSAGRGPFSANSSGNAVGGGMGTPASLQPTSTTAHSRHSYLTGQGPT